MSELNTINNINNLRHFHNWIKYNLISKSQKETSGEKLLDVAVGKGGDILKWFNSNIKYVTGIDNDFPSIHEHKKFDGAIKRYNILKRTFVLPECIFLNISATDSKCLELLNNKDNFKIYDIVSCQFSFHYFINEIDITLNLISNKLKTGGYFIGTASDGDLIKQKITDGNIDLPMLKIFAVSENSYEYKIKINNKNTHTYFDQIGSSIEYYLEKDFLIKKCSEYNLKLLKICNFEEWYNIYTTCSRPAGRRANLSEEEKVISFLNFSFIFIKI